MAQRLSLDERARIEVMITAGVSVAEAARRLERDPSTIHRELALNRDGAYDAEAAQAAAAARARRPKTPKLAADAALAATVGALLAHRMSPHAISALVAGEGASIAAETIYRACYDHSGRRGLPEGSWRLLPRRCRHRKPQGRHARKPSPLGVFRPICERPASVEDRSEAGHWEGDLIIGKNNRSAAVTLTERVSRQTLVAALPHGYDARRTADAVTAALARQPRHLVRTLTWDQGREMARWGDIEDALGVKVYFCDPRSPWQRPTNEQTNGLLRRWLPKGTDLNVGAVRLAIIEDHLNTMPRKLHDWHSAHSVYAELTCNHRWSLPRFNYEYGEAYDDSDYDIFVTDADGSNTVRVSHDDYRELEPAWSPDSTRIAYTRDTDPDDRYAEFEIVVTRADGSDPVKLADDGHDPVWSPDGSLIAYDGTFGGIYVADPDGGDARMLVDGMDPSWSPDGTLIAYSSDRYPTASVAPSAGTSGVMLFAGAAAAGLDDDIETASYQIHVIGADGANPVRLTQIGGNNSDPVWSPDGSRILYARHSNGNFIFVMNADGQQSLQITDNGQDPEWSPDGTRIAYTVDPRTKRPYLRSFYDVFVMSPDGSDLTKLADDGEEPSWSPDGTHVLYSNGDEVFMARSDGAGIRQITDTLGDERSWSPVWSPDGTRIAFRRGPGDGPLFVMNADGSDIRQLTQEAGRWRPPVWSPDSTRIAYSVTEGSEDIAVINADATGWANLTSDHSTMAHGREACQAWSSDSARIAFSAQPDGSWEDSDIWVMDADGTQKTQITDSRDDESCPVWSPDGNRFLYHVSRDVGEVAEISDIWVMNANGTDRRLLIERATRPEWSPDGGLITFMSDRDGDWEIFVMDSDGGNVTQLTFNNDYDIAPTWSPATGR